MHTDDFVTNELRSDNVLALARRQLHCNSRENVRLNNRATQILGHFLRSSFALVLEHAVIVEERSGV